LPSLKDLLPPPSWSSSSARSAAPVSLNTRDPIYVTYFNKIKQSIESHWEYPEMALRYGLQGKLSLEFTIGGKGQLEQLRLIRTSGSQLLDQEAMRAIKAAAPFPPIPPWIKPNPLSLSASMEYDDNRLNYPFGRSAEIPRFHFTPGVGTARRARVPSQHRLSCRSRLVQPSDRSRIWRVFDELGIFFAFLGNLQHRLDKAVQSLRRFGFRGFDHQRAGKHKGEIKVRWMVAVVQQSFRDIQRRDAVLVL